MSVKTFNVLATMIVAGALVSIVLGAIAQYWLTVIVGIGLVVLIVILRASIVRSSRRDH